MKISVIGTGYVGLVSGTCFAELGNKVICMDKDAKKIADLKNEIIPIYEPGLDELVKRNQQEGRLIFTTDAKQAIKESTIIFSAVGTPPNEDHQADLRGVKAVAASFGQYLDDYKIFVNKSTVPVGTAQMVRDIIKDKSQGDIDFDIVSNPEFLREGAAVKDFFNPERIVIGTDSQKARELIKELYEPLTRANIPLIFTSNHNAEIIKYASNAFLATKISFINELANYCDRLDGGVDIREIANGIGLDSRIGLRFLHAGIGYGGSCFPKDVKALIESGKSVGYNFRILKAVEEVNSEQKKLTVRKLRKHFPDLNEKKIAIWGLTFKPKTDDMREAPSIDVVFELTKYAAQVHVFDPVGHDNAKQIFANLKNVSFADNPYDAVEGADALLILTEWHEFRSPSFEKIKQNMKTPLVIDGRNIYNPKKMLEEGFIYESIGRIITLD